LGSTSVICSDKTGTMTANQMTARAIAMAGHRFTATGSGYEPDGTLLTRAGHPLDPRLRGHVEPLLRSMVLCANARVVRQGDRGAERWQCIGDPTEGALIVLAHKGGVEREGAEREAPRIREFPFESVRRRMATVHALPGGEVEVLVKGSPEAVLEASTRVRHGTGTVALGPDEEARVMLDVEALADDGLRVLAFATRKMRTLPETPAEAEHDLELLGLVGMADPVRPEVPDAIARCRGAGIRVVMITGDHPSTAAAVARKAGLPVSRVLLGPELPSEDDRLEELLADPTVTVLARVAPEQKLRIAGTFQALGHVVAMTGDGVNDAPALRQADIGVAMGIVGTDVAREAADLVLLDDNFAHIVEAVEEGRAAFDNIRRFLTYHLTDNVAELAPFVAWAVSGGRIPLVISVIQVLALDIGTDIFPALALGAERPTPGTMTRPPRPRGVGMLDGPVLVRSLGFLGPVEAVLSMALLPLAAGAFFGWSVGANLPANGIPLSVISTMVFASIALMQKAVAFECRSTDRSIFSIGPLSNHLLDLAIVVETLGLMAFIYVPPLARILGQHALSGGQWLPVLVTPALLLGAEEARKWAARHRARDHALSGVPSVAPLASARGSAREAEHLPSNVVDQFVEPGDQLVEAVANGLPVDQGRDRLELQSHAE